jgi:cell division protease FtsH
MSSRPYAEATQAEIDREVSKLLRQAEDRAVELLKAHRPELDGLVELLLVRETVAGSDVYRLAGRPDRSATPSAPAAVVAPHRASEDTPGAKDTASAASGTTSADGSTPGQ